MTDHKWHPLTAVGMMFGGVGAVLLQLAPALIGLASVVLGWWLQRQENMRHERTLAERERAPRLYRPDGPEMLN